MDNGSDYDGKLFYATEVEYLSCVSFLGGVVFRYRFESSVLINLKMTS